MATAALGGTIGDPIKNYGNADTAVGSIQVYLGSFPDVGDAVHSFTFDGAVTKGATWLTPLLFTSGTNSQNWILAGVGQSIQNISGVQTDSYVPLYGSSLVTAGMTFGWYSGQDVNGVLTGNQGVVEFETTNLVGDSPGTAQNDFFNSAPLTIGNDYSFNHVFSGNSPTNDSPRLYAVEASATPEPATFILLGGPLAAIGCVRRRLPRA